MRALHSSKTGLITVACGAALAAAAVACSGSESPAPATSTTTATTATTSSGSGGSDGASQASSTQSTVSSTVASTSGAGGSTSTECDPPAAPDSIFATSDTKVGDVAPSSMCQYRGQVMFIFNAAELCGYTPQTTALQKVQGSYEAKGLTVLGFYSDDFGNQGGSPDTCNSKYGVTFDTFEVAPVKGANARPVFAWLLKQPNPGPAAEIAPQWNFSKYLVDRKGKLVKHWSHTVVPDAKEITDAIEAELAKSP